MVWVSNEMFRSIASLLRMKSNQWKSRGELEGMQRESFSRLLEHARRKVPFYKNYPSSEIEGLPLLSKERILESPEAFLSSPKAELFSFPTSGSSGQPMQVYYSGIEGAYGAALSHFQFMEAGAAPWKKVAAFSYQVAQRSLFLHLFGCRWKYFSIFDSEQSHLAAISKLRPDIALSCPSLLSLLAHENNEQGAGVRIPKIFSRSEHLSHRERALIEDSFSCKTHNFYGTNEASWVAWECDEGGMHVHSDSLILEVLDDDGAPLPPGREGQIAITPLWRTSMPFIRYLIGDRGALGGKCRCGRGTHILKKLEGRCDDYLCLPSGRALSARAINLLDDVHSLKCYQIVQRKENEILFRYVPQKSFLHSDKALIRDRILRGCRGEHVDIEFEETDTIERGRTGKIQTVVSMLGGSKE